MRPLDLKGGLAPDKGGDMSEPMLYVNLETGFVGDVDSAAFGRMSERHYVELAPTPDRSGVSAANALDAQMRSLVIALSGGLPQADELELSMRALTDGRKVFFHWPQENVVEVVTDERIDSFRRHRRLINAYWRWRALRRGIAVGKRDLALRVKSNLNRLGRAARAPINAATIAASKARGRVAALASRVEGSKAANHATPNFGFLIESGGRLAAQGRGLYFRLDYWAKLVGGGSYGHTVYQSKALHRSTSDGLICVVSSKYALLDELGVNQIVIPPRGHLADEFSLVENGEAYARVVAGLIDLYKPAYVFERLVLGNATVARACAEAGVPYIAEYNGSELTMSKVFGGREMNNAEKLQSIEIESFSKAQVISVVSEAVKQTVIDLGVAPEKILVNPNCVDLEEYATLGPEQRADLRASLGFGANDIVLGFCGTFGGWHGVEVLAEAIPAIAAQRPAARFLFIGDGQLKHLVRDAIAAAGIGARVHDAGMTPQREAARLLSACDIFLSPHSKNMGDMPFFGSPTKLFEYMAYGGGIVCSDLEQLGEVMRPAARVGEIDAAPSDARSILVKPGSVDDLVRASIALIDNPDLRALLGRNARQAVSSYYTWDVHVQSLWRFARGDDPVGYHVDRRIL